LSPELKAKLDAGEVIGSTLNSKRSWLKSSVTMASALTIDDMFQMARDNLKESLDIRSNDPYAHLYYGKVLKLTARTVAEKQGRPESVCMAIQLDGRRVLPEPHLSARSR